MPFQTPQFPEIRARALVDLQNALGLGPAPRRSMVAALAGALAGAVAGAHGFNEWVSRQVFPDTAEAANLERWANIFGVARKPAAFASGTVNLKGGLLNVGAVVPKGTIVNVGALRYQSTAAAAVDGTGFAPTPIEAMEAGAGYNLPEGTRVYLPNPIPQINNSAFVAAPGVTGGTDVEPDSELRDRLLLRLQNPPRGGVATDYEAWALQVPGVTRAWALPNHAGIGTVGLTFMRDGEGDGIPDANAIEDVEQHVEPLMPIGAELVVFAPGVLEVDFSLSISPDTPALRAAVEASIDDLLDRASEPGGTIFLSHVHEAISTTPGEFDHTLTAPAANVEMGAGEIARKGTVTWL